MFVTPLSQMGKAGGGREGQEGRGGPKGRCPGGPEMALDRAIRCSGDTGVSVYDG